MKQSCAPKPDNPISRQRGRRRRMRPSNATAVVFALALLMSLGNGLVPTSFFRPSNGLHNGINHSTSIQENYCFYWSSGYNSKNDCKNTALWATGNNPSGADDANRNNPAQQDGGNSRKEPNNGQKYSVARAGGRKAKTNARSNDGMVKEEKSDNGLFGVISQWTLPLLFLSLLFRFIFGGVFAGASNPNVVYYSRSVYQSTTYSKDGNVETTRRESFQSNIPGLVEKAQGTTSSAQTFDSNVRGARNYLDSDIEDELDELEDEIDSLLFKGW